jgi:hypothetical protein
MNDAVMHITSCSLTRALTLANAAFCHGRVILAFDLTLLEVVSPLFASGTKLKSQILIYES